MIIIIRFVYLFDFISSSFHLLYFCFVFRHNFFSHLKWFFLSKLYGCHHFTKSLFLWFELNRMISCCFDDDYDQSITYRYLFDWLKIPCCFLPVMCERNWTQKQKLLVNLIFSKILIIIPKELHQNIIR